MCVGARDTGRFSRSLRVLRAAAPCAGSLEQKPVFLREREREREREGYEDEDEDGPPPFFSCSSEDDLLLLQMRRVCARERLDAVGMDAVNFAEGSLLLARACGVGAAADVHVVSEHLAFLGVLEKGSRRRREGKKTHTTRKRERREGNARGERARREERLASSSSCASSQRGGTRVSSKNSGVRRARWRRPF